MVNAIPKRRNNCKIILNTSSILALLFAASVSASGVGIDPASDLTPNGIVGTGNKGFSEVTPSGIVGTGNKDFSEVTPSGIVGTGNKDFSEVTPNGIVGTGNKDFSEVTPSGIVGTGNKDFSEVTPSGIVGTGNKDFSEVTPSGIVGTGNKGFSQVTPSGIVGTGAMTFEAENNYLRFQKWATQVNPAGSSLVVYGPIEAILENKVVALGQDVFLTGPSMRTDLSLGQTVAVFGVAREDGIDATKILRVTEPHVEGSSAVYLSGIATGQARLDGAFKIGRILVQIGEAGVNPSVYEVESLDFVEVTGIQIGGIVLADTVN